MDKSNTDVVAVVQLPKWVTCFHQPVGQGEIDGISFSLGNTLNGSILVEIEGRTYKVEAKGAIQAAYNLHRRLQNGAP